MRCSALKEILKQAMRGQFEWVETGQSLFAPPFFDKANAADQTVMSSAQQPPNFSIGGEGKIAFAPEGTDWVFSAAVRYGPSNAGRHPHRQTQLAPVTRMLNGHSNSYTPVKGVFADAQTELRETHTVLDLHGNCT